MVDNNRNKQEEIINVTNGYENVAVMQQTSQDKDEIEIDLMKVVGLMLDHMHYIILCFLVGALLFNAYAYFMIHPTYQSTAKLYVVSASEDSVVNLSDLNIGMSLTSDYEELIYSYPVLDKVISKMDLNLSTEGLARMISINNPEDTRVLVLTTTCEDPEMAKDITNTLVEVIVEYLPETMSTQPPNVAQYARLEEGKVAPGYLKYTVLGALFAAGIYCTIILFMYMTDDTIKSLEDFESTFGIVPLAVIPESEIFIEEENVESKKGLFGRRRK